MKENTWNFENYYGKPLTDGCRRISRSAWAWSTVSDVIPHHEELQAKRYQKSGTGPRIHSCKTPVPTHDTVPHHGMLKHAAGGGHS